jgi:uncharacterized membrane protein
MESHAKAFGHPIHPMLIVFPLGLLTAALIFDILYYMFDNATLAEVAYYNIAAGIIGGLVAAIFGLIDLVAIPGGTRAKRVGFLHAAGNVVVLLLFAISWWLRRDVPDHVPGTWAFLLALIGIGLSLFTGWLGAELIYRLRVSVHDNAHLDAPSSLSGRPAVQSVDRHKDAAQTHR